MTAILCGCMWETNLATGASILLMCAMHLERMLDDTPQQESR